MGQLRWTYLGDGGQNYDVGLYHGEDTGHVMLYVNSDIVLIDFSVIQSKQYSLYLGDELCDLYLEEDNGSFSYGLVPNTQIDTDLNRARRKEAIKNNIKTVLLGIIMVLTIITLNILLVSCSA